MKIIWMNRVVRQRMHSNCVFDNSELFSAQGGASSYLPQSTDGEYFPYIGLEVRNGCKR